MIFLSVSITVTWPGVEGRGATTPQEEDMLVVLRGKCLKWESAQFYRPIWCLYKDSNYNLVFNTEFLNLLCSLCQATDIKER